MAILVPKNFHKKPDLNNIVVVNLSYNENRLNNGRVVLVVKPILAVLLAIGNRKRELAFLQPVARPLKKTQENR
ncbi:hypothetical protein [Cuspidothrix issatschenkoi]|uniref:hypothetical protein n=1 Tax=Cuspidothrix issatschenkoi TaxID=230752 RepID=UPI001D149B72|nr:hypothetical protein [Cuspidothrix issatschenkoi]